jgi:hypothetical protein
VQNAEQQIAKKAEKLLHASERSRGSLKILYQKERRARDRLCRYAQWCGAIAPPHGRSHADPFETTVDPLLILLRRFATELAREEARMLCDELMVLLRNLSAF